MQVYACVYTANGDFLLGTKPALGYYFSSGGGSLHPNGQPLNGGGRYALPGGRRERGESTRDGAAREWQEETACPMSINQASSHEWGTAYGAGYFRQPDGDLQGMLDLITNDVLPAAALAVRDITNGTITAYPQIFALFPDAPADNELAAMTLWNVVTDWARIQQWDGDPTIGWYYNILKYLREDILGI
ncbi:NUDIX domain-containing protein [Fulvimonas sp. R45]|jgi:8-oxo-dGTP pyrophosphatase MutT (NUDIX family)|uniref:NUDIX domain-containing protein n=1 Tax=Fulvimonas sp. R45 TaxID=3045937 RepID=UPI00265EB5AF|nr:NUDIX domain-containing protein [Fulvimonas sp. R45]MDO1529819.1 NUDIX domain-containing protein [Fulvimonas sp. R45]